MRDSVLKLLDQWECKNSEDVHEYDKEVSDYELNSVIRFLKKVAYDENDDSLLGRIARIEIRLENEREIEALKEIEEEEEEYLKYQNVLNLSNNIRRVCIEEFFENKSFFIDMSKYKSEIDKNLEFFTDHSALKRILKYIDEKTAIDKAYKEVSDHLRNNADFENSNYCPTIEEVGESFEAVKENIYRRADIYIAKQIEKAKAKAA